MAVETATFQLVMPAMGDSVAEGTILEWHKHEGDTVNVDETVVEISTDKVDAEVPAPVAGRIVKIHAAEGDTVAVGALLAEIATNGAPRPRNGEAGRAAAARACTGRTEPPSGADAGPRRQDRRHRHPDRRRVGHRGHDPRVVGQGRRRGRGRRYGRRDLDRQGRHGASRARERDDHGDPVRGGRRRSASAR